MKGEDGEKDSMSTAERSTAFCRDKLELCPALADQ
jgi:hypothetical protein